MQKRKGFTLVELVIVIAVIAILAGVLIGTFASVINRANASAEVQKTKSEEIAQKAEDILKKIEDSNWYGWEDFETSIVAKITQEIKNNSAGLDADQVKKIINDALTTWQANHQAGNTDLTKEQVKAIVENAVGTLHYEGVTEAQVRAIVNASGSSLASQLIQPVQIKQIVTAANEKNLTAAQVANIIANTSATEVSDIITALNTATAGLATEVQVENLRNDIKALAVEAADDVVKAKAFNIRINKAGLNSTNAKTVYDVLVGINALDETDDLTSSAFLFDLDNLKFFVVDAEGKVFNNCGLTLVEGEALTDAYKYWTFANEKSATYSTYLTGTASYGALSLDGVGVDVGEAFATSINYTNSTTTPKAVVIRTNDGTFRTELTVNAENDTVSHYGYLAELVVEKIYTSSYHEFGKILGKVVIKKGHIVVENGAEVPQISVESATGAVKVTANNSTLVSVDAGSASQTSVVANSDDVYVTGLAAENISGSQASNVELPTVVTNEAELAEAIANKKAYIQLGADFTANEVYVINSETLIDFAGYTITATKVGTTQEQYVAAITAMTKGFAFNNTPFLTNNSTLTIADTKGNGGITSSNNIIIHNNSKLVFNGGKLNSTMLLDKYNSGRNGLDANSDNNLYRINLNSTILRGVLFNDAEGTLTFNDGTIEVTSDYAFLNSGTAVFNGGYIISHSDNALGGYGYAFSQKDGNVTVNYVHINAVHGAFGFNGGKAVVNDALVDFASSGNKFYALYIAGEYGYPEVIINGGTFNKGGSNVVYVGNKNDGGEGNLAMANIYGGTFNGGIYATLTSENNYGIGMLKIFGGTYTINPTAVKSQGQGTATYNLVAEGYKATKNNNVWVVIEE